MMQQLTLNNPFGTPIFHIDETTSTMDEARRLAATGAAEVSLHGAVIVTDYQQAGRGRAAGRSWHAKSGESLLCTLMLRYQRIQDIPTALPLRLGVALALTLEALWPALTGRICLKWPNDVLIDRKKVSGILCEGEVPWIYAGMGVNLLQKDFPPDLVHRSISILQALGLEQPDRLGLDRYHLLINLLDHIHTLIEKEPESPLWQDELAKRLYKKGEPVRFLAGSAETPTEVLGILEGITPAGELCIRETGTNQTRTFITGELEIYSTR